MSFLDFDFMQRALLAAGLIGLAAPAIGVFLVQRRLSLMGDGIGHIALSGVALGFLTHTSPLLLALVAAVVGAVVIELLRHNGKVAGDVALAIIFYGGIAGGVFLTSISEASPGGLISYLFGSVLTVTAADVWIVAALSAAVLLSTTYLRKQYFAVCYDEEAARASGLKVKTLNILMAVTAALTVVVAMRVVGLLLVSALMVLPVATSQGLARSFKGTVGMSLAIGLLTSVAGLIAAFYVDSAPGPTIILVSLGLFFSTRGFSRLRLAK